jgi:anaerobic selenocysteine-containing dehydrogenase
VTAWEDVAKINLWMQKKLGLKTGDKIPASPPDRQARRTAKLWEGVRPGTVAGRYGQGHWVYGRVASKVFGKEPRGGNNNEVLPAVYDRLSGSTVRHAATRVKIEKI